jgi:hypothetical protein
MPPDCLQRIHTPHMFLQIVPFKAFYFLIEDNFLFTPLSDDMVRQLSEDTKSNNTEADSNNY